MKENLFLNSGRFMLKHEYAYPLFFLLLVLLYYPILETYAITDAYEFFWSAKRNPNFIDVFIQGGRPLQGLVFTFLFSWAETVSDLKYIRLFAFAGNLLLIYCFYNYLIKLNLNNCLLPIVLFLAVSPFIALSMSWTALFQGGWAMLAALFSAQSILKTLDSAPLYKNVLHLILGIVLGLVSLMLYQPAMTFFIFIVFLSYEKNHNLKKYIVAAGLYLLIFIFYFLLFKLSLSIFELPPLERSGLSFDILHKASWFIETVLWKSAKLNLLLVKGSLQNIFRILVMLLIIVATIKYLIKQSFSRALLIYIIIISVTYSFAYIPNLASTENYVSNRSLGTVLILNVYFFYKALAYLINSKIFLKWISVLSILFFCIVGFINLRWGIVKIHSTEYAVLYEATKNIINENPQVEVLTLIQPSINFLQEQKFVKRSEDEFGLLSNSKPWTTKPMFFGILEELSKKEGHTLASIRLNVCSHKEHSLCRNEKPSIDIGAEFMKHYTEYY